MSTPASTTARRPLTPEDLVRIQQISDPQISPDGLRVAFVATTLSEERDEHLSTIWMIDTVGGAPRRFTTGTRDTAPRWAPDGRRLAFVSEREPGKPAQLYVMPSDGGEAIRLTNLKNGVWGPVWSPDGQRLVFMSRVGGWQEPEREEERRKSKPVRVITSLRYKQDGEGFTYDRRPHVFVVSADGGEPRQITQGDFVHWDPCWSPDGRLIAFASARHETRDDDWAGDIWVVPAEGGEPRALTDTSGPVALPAFSPDGRAIAYLGHRYPCDDGRNIRLFAVPLDGGKPICLTERFDRRCGFIGSPYLVTKPVWAADGLSILVEVQDQADCGVWRVPVEGGEPEQVIGGARAVFAFSVSADGSRIAFAATDPLSPAEVFTCRGDGTDERALTDLNGRWKSEVALSPPERFTLRRDGFSIDAWVMRPAAFDPDRRYPALLWIHGGPHRAFSHAFWHEAQVYAAAGYAVVYTNPRGSQGYGEAFSRAVVADWGGGDYEDIMAGLDEAPRRYPWIDPDRLGVMGISYGGYMTNWIIGHTDRFKAACAEGSISNVHTQFGTSDIGPAWNPSEAGRVLPWEDPQWYVQHSPLTYAKNVTTPLLLIHAEHDLRCPIEQAEQMFVALKKLRREVVLVRVPDESHGLTAWRSRHRLERLRLILEWFGKRLRPDAQAAP